MLDYPLSVNTKVSLNRLSAISIESLAAPVLLRFTPSGRELFGTCCEDVANGFTFGVAAQRCLDWHCKFWSSLNVYLYTLIDQMEESFCHQIECEKWWWFWDCLKNWNLKIPWFILETTPKWTCEASIAARVLPGFEVSSTPTFHVGETHRQMALGDQMAARKRRVQNLRILY